jgi:hypothetical protein
LCAWRVSADPNTDEVAKQVQGSAETQIFVW